MVGRVGDGGGLRLEREKEKGKEIGRLPSRRLNQRHGERAVTHMLMHSQPAGGVAICNSFNAVIFHSPSMF